MSTTDSGAPERAGIVEVNVEHLKHSPLWNEDLSPVPLEKRTWTAWNYAALWIGMSVCIPTYMLGGYLIQGGMSWWQAVFTILLANAIVLVPIVMNGHAGTRFGIPFPIIARSVFGTYGSNIPALMRAMVACGWFGIQTWVGAKAMYEMGNILAPGLIKMLNQGPPVLGITFGELVMFLLFWLINMVFVWIGTESIRWLESLSAPFLIIIGLVLLGWAVNKAGSMNNGNGWGPLFSQKSKFESTGALIAAFFFWLTAMVGYWSTLALNSSDFTRFARSQRDQAIGQFAGLPTTMTLYAFIGIGVTSATAVIYGEPIADPVAVLAKFDSKIVALISLFALIIATITTNIAANIVSPANDFSNVAPKWISFKTGGTIAGIIGIIMMPWKLFGHVEGYLIAYSALLGPIAALMICDYFILRKKRLNIPDLYRPDGSFPAFNWVSLICLAVAVLPNLPGFIGTLIKKDMGFFSKIYPYAWFIGFTIAFVLYALVGAMGVRRESMDMSKMGVKEGAAT